VKEITYVQNVYSPKYNLSIGPLSFEKPKESLEKKSLPLMKNCLLGADRPKFSRNLLLEFLTAIFIGLPGVRQACSIYFNAKNILDNNEKKFQK